MDLHEKIIEENKERGIAPMLTQQHSKHRTCENCGEQIDPTRQGSTGRYMDEAEAKVYPELTNPVYAHVDCPEEGV
jgi:NADH pyrophosphatase NudC (nudix superfamily)